MLLFLNKIIISQLVNFIKKILLNIIVRLKDKNEDFPTINNLILQFPKLALLFLSNMIIYNKSLK